MYLSGERDSVNVYHKTKQTNPSKNQNETIKNNEREDPRPMVWYQI